MAKKELLINSDLSLDAKVSGLIMCVAQEQKVAVEQQLKPMDLSLSQLQLLHSLSHSPEKCLTVNQLKQNMLDDSPNVSRALNKLVDKGFVSKLRSEKDQRTVYVHITQAGEQIHNQADQRLLNNFQFKLTEAELTQLYQLLVKI